jgi:hypothetical protein
VLNGEEFIFEVFYFYIQFFDMVNMNFFLVNVTRLFFSKNIEKNDIKNLIKFNGDMKTCYINKSLVCFS